MKSYFKFLGRNKAYAAIDVFGLAISMMFVVLIGCYTWQESHVDTQHSKADRMYFLGLDIGNNKMNGAHWRLQPILKDKFPEIESSTAMFRNRRWLRYDNQEIETNCFFVDSTFYDIFDFKLIQGDPETVLDNPSNIVVTQEYARRVWGDVDPIGQSIVFNVEEPPFVVAGVMEPMENTSFMTWDRHPVDMLLNFSMMKYVNVGLYEPQMSNAVGVEVVLLAKEGHDLTTKKKEYEAELKKHYWILNLPEDEIRLDIFPFRGSYFANLSNSGNSNSGDGNMMRLLFCVGLVILLFAIMNYINLTVALAGKRAKEMATRRLLGEGRGSIMWRLIGESSILCSVSMILGIALAFLMEPFASVLTDIRLDILSCMNFTTTSFLLAVLVIMSVVAGIIPAFMLSSVKPVEAVKGSFRRESKMVFGKIFIVVQNVATILMVASALTMYLQVRHLINAPLGYETKGIMNLYIGNMNLYIDEVADENSGKGELLRSELLKLSCVEKVSYSQGEPHTRGNNNTMMLDGHTISFQTFVGDSAFMDILGLKLKKEIPEAGMERNYLNNQAISELGIDENSPDYQYYEERKPISGIMEDFRLGNILTSQSPVRIVVGVGFYPWNMLIKTVGDEKEAQRQIKGVFEKLYPEESFDKMFERPFLSQQIEDDFKKERRLMVIITVFAMIAIIIAMLGLMAMSTYYVRQRSLDIAVRKVMGGTSLQVMAKLVCPFMLYVVIAAVISVPLIYYVMNDWLSQFSYRISVYWWIYAATALFAIVICFVSVVNQCYKAANTNPIDSLK